MAEIKIENVSKTYSSKEGTVQALKNVSLTIRSGEIYGIIGMSGAGKSTLVRCMNFLEQPTSGNVLIKGRALGGLKEKELRKQREQIGMIFQHFNLLMQKSVLENVCFPMYIQGKKKKGSKRKSGRTSGNRRIEGKSKCISFSIIRWSKTESCNCKSTCNIA